MFVIIFLGYYNLFQIFLTEYLIRRSEYLILKKIQAVIFDLDGTLIDTSDDIVASINFLRKHYGLDHLCKKDAMKAVGQGFDYLIRTSLAELNLKEPQINFAKDFFSKHYMEHIADNSRPYEGIRTALKSLKKKNYSLCVATNKEKAMTEKILNFFSLGKYFDIKLAGGMGFSLKPNPAMILEITEKKALDKNRTVIIGDSWADILSAKNAGCISILAQWGFNDTRGYKADFTASYPLDLVAFF